MCFEDDGEQEFPFGGGGGDADGAGDAGGAGDTGGGGDAGGAGGAEGGADAGVPEGGDFHGFE